MKHKTSKKWDFLKIEGQNILKIRKNCPRCGDGVYMAGHKEKDGRMRNYCGKCHYTVWLSDKSN